MEPLRSGRLNWIQDAWWVDDPKNMDTHANNMVIPCSAEGADMPGLLSAIRVVFDIHEPLRTLYERNASGYFWQHVMETPRDLSSVPGLITLTSFDEAGEMLLEAMGRRFELDRVFPIRFVVVAEGPRLLGLGIIGDHAVFDAWGMQVVRDDLLRALQGATAQEYDPVAQPLDLVDWEDSPGGVQYHERATDFWRHQLEIAHEIPVESVWKVDQDALFASCTTRSKAMFQDARAAAGRLRVPDSAIFMMAFASALGELNDSDSIGFMTKTIGRLSKKHRNSAGHMASHAPVVLDLTSGGDLALAEQATSLTLLAHRYGRVNRRRMEELLRTDFPRVPSLAIAAAAAPNMVGALFNYIGFYQEDPAGGGNAVERILNSLDDEDRPFDRIHHVKGLKQGANLMLNILPTADSVELALTYRDCTPISSACEKLLPLMQDHLRALAS